mmetsp:Transcript_22081/g.62720  ORF Transcript_22081/g.62720 Transcript_22081/m.62720 type:complete len:267 (-) Transcript_22081:1146-1946(-)
MAQVQPMRTPSAIAPGTLHGTSQGVPTTKEARTQRHVTAETGSPEPDQSYQAQGIGRSGLSPLSSPRSKNFPTSFEGCSSYRAHARPSVHRAQAFGRRARTVLPSLGGGLSSHSPSRHTVSRPGALSPPAASRCSRVRPSRRSLMTQSSMRQAICSCSLRPRICLGLRPVAFRNASSALCRFASKRADVSSALRPASSMAARRMDVSLNFPPATKASTPAENTTATLSSKCARTSLTSASARAVDTSTRISSHFRSRRARTTLSRR